MESPRPVGCTSSCDFLPNLCPSRKQNRADFCKKRIICANSAFIFSNVLTLESHLIIKLFCIIQTDNVCSVCYFRLKLIVIPNAKIEFTNSRSHCHRKVFATLVRLPMFFFPTLFSWSIMEILNYLRWNWRIELTKGFHYSDRVGKIHS